MKKILITALLALSSSIAMAAPKAPSHNVAVEICMLSAGTEAECQKMIGSRTPEGLAFLNKAAEQADLKNYDDCVRDAVQLCAKDTGNEAACVAAVLSGDPKVKRFADSAKRARRGVCGFDGKAPAKR